MVVVVLVVVVVVVVVLLMVGLHLQLSMSDSMLVYCFYRADYAQMYFGRWKEFIASSQCLFTFRNSSVNGIDGIDCIDKNLIFLEYLLWPNQ